jgi:hypothetical protein
VELFSQEGITTQNYDAYLKNMNVVQGFMNNKAEVEAIVESTKLDLERSDTKLRIYAAYCEILQCVSIGDIVLLFECFKIFEKPNYGQM